jgi:hypothetical protein
MLFIIAGCKESADTPLTPGQEQLLTRTGVVAETLEVENYTYIRLEAVHDDAWIATLPTWVSPGDVIEFTGGAVMNDFYSESLNRNFKTILFVDNMRIVDEQAGAEIVDKAHSKPSVAPSPATSDESHMEPIEPVGEGETIAEIFAGYAEREGQTVKLRARVVKVSSGILGKNWVTLEDGTGTDPNNQIVTTTLDTVSPGDLVDVTAVIKKDVDLGYGYEYALLLEEATISPAE